MNWEDERAAFELRVTNNFTTLPMQFSGVPFDVPTSGGWVRMSLLPGAAKRITLGSGGVFREFGTLLFQIFVPVNTGTAGARQIADQLSDIFHEAVFEHGGSGKIRCYVPMLDDRGDTTSGVWHQLNLAIDYQRDVVIA